jgi:hypothetical protein
MQSSLEKLQAELTKTQHERDRLREALVRIRDSTYRNAVTLRGVADDAIATLEGKP